MDAESGGEWFRWVLSGAAVVISGMATVILGDQRSKMNALSVRIETVRNEHLCVRQLRIIPHEMAIRGTEDADAMVAAVRDV